MTPWETAVADNRLLREQLDYYNARAPEYDDWWYRRGRYDRGIDANACWIAEVAQLEQAVAAFAPLGHVAELAAGTGLWTRWLAPVSKQVVAVDASQEMLVINRARVGTARVDHVRADIFDWVPPRRFDEVFLGFWLSHVPPERFEVFWQLVDRLVVQQGRFFFIDSLYSETSTAVDHRLEGTPALSATRRLNDGREFRVVKVYYDPADLRRRLQELGWDADVRTTGRFFLYGYGRRR